MDKKELDLVHKNFKSKMVNTISLCFADLCDKKDEIYSHPQRPEDFINQFIIEWVEQSFKCPLFLSKEEAYNKIDKMYSSTQKVKPMDKKIKKIQKDTKKVSGELKSLLKEDKKRDKVCERGTKLKGK